MPSFVHEEEVLQLKRLLGQASRKNDFYQKEVSSLQHELQNSEKRRLALHQRFLALGLENATRQGIIQRQQESQKALEGQLEKAQIISRTLSHRTSCPSELESLTRNLSGMGSICPAHPRTSNSGQFCCNFTDSILISRVKELESDAAKLTRDLKCKNTQMQDVKAANGHGVAQLQKLQKKLQEVLQHKSARVVSLEADLKRLRNECSDLRGRTQVAVQREIQLLQEQANLQTVLSSSRAAADVLRSELAAVELAKQGLEKQLCTMRSQDAATSRSASQLQQEQQAALAAIGRTATSASSASNAVGGLHCQNQKLHSRVQLLLAGLASLDGAVAKLEGLQQATTTQLQQSREQRECEVGLLQVEKRQHCTAAVQLGEAAGCLDAALKASSSARAEAGQVHAGLVEVCELLQQQCAGLQDSLQRQRVDAAELRVEAKGLQDSLQRQRVEAVGLRAEASGLQDSLRTSQQEGEQLRHTCAALMADCAQLRLQYGQLAEGVQAVFGLCEAHEQADKQLRVWDAAVAGMCDEVVGQLVGWEGEQRGLLEAQGKELALLRETEAMLRGACGKRDAQVAQLSGECARQKALREQQGEEVLRLRGEESRLLSACSRQEVEIAALQAEREGDIARLQAEQMESARLQAERQGEITRLQAEREGVTAQLQAKQEGQIRQLQAEQATLAQSLKAQSAELRGTQLELLAGREQRLAGQRGQVDELRELVNVLLAAQRELLPMATSACKASNVRAAQIAPKVVERLHARVVGVEGCRTALASAESCGSSGGGLSQGMVSSQGHSQSEQSLSGDREAGSEQSESSPALDPADWLDTCLHSGDISHLKLLADKALADHYRPAALSPPSSPLVSAHLLHTHLKSCVEHLLYSDGVTILRLDTRPSTSPTHSLPRTHAKLGSPRARGKPPLLPMLSMSDNESERIGAFGRGGHSPSDRSPFGCCAGSQLGPMGQGPSSFCDYHTAGSLEDDAASRASASSAPDDFHRISPSPRVCGGPTPPCPEAFLIIASPRPSPELPSTSGAPLRPLTLLTFEAPQPLDAVAADLPRPSDAAEVSASPLQDPAPLGAPPLRDAMAAGLQPPSDAAALGTPPLQDPGVPGSPHAVDLVVFNWSRRSSSGGGGLEVMSYPLPVRSLRCSVSNLHPEDGGALHVEREATVEVGGGDEEAAQYALCGEDGKDAELPARAQHGGRRRIPNGPMAGVARLVMGVSGVLGAMALR